MPSLLTLPDVLSRNDFVKMIPNTARILEIGPYNNPSLRSSEFPTIKYMDMFTAEEIRADENRYTHTVEIPNTIDIVVKPEQRPSFQSHLRFDFIYGAHNIEHYPDVVYHLNEIAGLAASYQTKYFVTVPDKRYCFDCYQHESDFTEMVAAHLEERKSHTFGSYLRHTVFATHNNIYGHWMGDHGEDPRRIPLSINYATEIRKKMDSARDEKQRKFADIHAWYFTPDSFRYNINMLNYLGLQPWHVDAVTPPQHMTPEFHAILSLTRYVNQP